MLVGLLHPHSSIPYVHMGSSIGLYTVSYSKTSEQKKATLFLIHGKCMGVLIYISCIS